MATPLRKDQPREELSTADLAQGRTQNRPEPGNAKPVASERVSADANKVQPIRDEHDSTPLFPNNELDNLRNRWKEIQTAFVDEPRKAVEKIRLPGFEMRGWIEIENLRRNADEQAFGRYDRDRPDPGAGEGVLRRRRGSGYDHCWRRLGRDPRSAGRAQVHGPSTTPGQVPGAVQLRAGRSYPPQPLVRVRGHRQSVKASHYRGRCG